jgi:hypothetical protein
MPNFITFFLQKKKKKREAFGVQKGLCILPETLFISSIAPQISLISQCRPAYPFASVYAKIVCPQTPNLVAEKGKDTV